METETRKASAIVALVAATGVATVELPRSLAQAGPVSGSAGYAGARVDEVFKVVAEMLPVAQISIPMAVKGDLEIPLSCVGPFQPNVQAECMDVAYEVESGPYVVVETRTATSSILTRMLGYATAIFEDSNQQTR